MTRGIAAKQSSAEWAKGGLLVSTVPGSPGRGIRAVSDSGFPKSQPPRDQGQDKPGESGTRAGLRELGRRTQQAWMGWRSRILRCAVIGRGLHQHQAQQQFGVEALEGVVPAAPAVEKAAA